MKAKFLAFFIHHCKNVSVLLLFLVVRVVFLPNVIPGWDDLKDGQIYIDYHNNFFFHLIKGIESVNGITEALLRITEVWNIIYYRTQRASSRRTHLQLTYLERGHDQTETQWKENIFNDQIVSKCDQCSVEGFHITGH